MTGNTWGDVKFLTIYELAVIMRISKMSGLPACALGRARGDQGRPVLPHSRAVGHQLHARRGLHAHRPSLLTLDTGGGRGRRARAPGVRAADAEARRG